MRDSGVAEMGLVKGRYRCVVDNHEGLWYSRDGPSQG